MRPAPRTRQCRGRRTAITSAESGVRAAAVRLSRVVHGACETHGFIPQLTALAICGRLSRVGDAPYWTLIIALPPRTRARLLRAARKRVRHRHRSRSRHPRTSRDRSGTEALIFLDADAVPEALCKAPNGVVRISARRREPARAGKRHTLMRPGRRPPPCEQFAVFCSVTAGSAPASAQYGNWVVGLK